MFVWAPSYWLDCRKNQRRTSRLQRWNPTKQVLWSLSFKCFRCLYSERVVLAMRRLSILRGAIYDSSERSKMNFALLGVLDLIFSQQRKIVEPSAQNRSGAHCCRRQVRFNKVQRRSWEGSGEGLEGFGAEAGQVQQVFRESARECSGRLWWQDQVRFFFFQGVQEEVPEKLAEKVLFLLFVCVHVHTGDLLYDCWGYHRSLFHCKNFVMSPATTEDGLLPSKKWQFQIRNLYGGAGSVCLCSPTRIFHG